MLKASWGEPEHLYCLTDKAYNMQIENTVGSAMVPILVMLEYYF